MKARPLTNEEFARRQLNHKGYWMQEGQVRFATVDGFRLVCPVEGDAVETYRLLDLAGWPTRDWEIPCSECGEHQSRLGGLCLRCQANYHDVD